MRKQEGFNGPEYEDCLQAKKQIKEFEAAISACGFGAEQIRKYENADKQTLVAIRREVVRKLSANAQNGFRTLIVWFYAGRGASKANQTVALINSNSQDPSWPLESVMHDVA